MAQPISLPSEIIISAAQAMRIDFKILNADEAEIIRELVVEKFTDNEFSKWKNYKITWIWLHLKPLDYSSVYDPEAWKDLDDYLCGKSFLLFFNYEQDKTILVFSEGTRLVPLIEEDEVLEFYLTDQQITYLLCFNHEQVLIGTGDATQWIQSYYT